MKCIKQRKKNLLLLSVLVLSVFSVLPVRAQVYTITEEELKSIERLKAKSEAEKQSWLEQIRKSEETQKNLEKHSQDLTEQLKNQRELNQNLEKYFREYESEVQSKLTDTSSELSETKIKLQKEKGQKWLFLSVSVFEALLVIMYIIFRLKHKL